MGWLDKQERRNRETGRVEVYWSIQDRIEGKKIKRSLGFVPEAEARRLLTIYEGERAAGNSPLADPAPVASESSSHAEAKSPTLAEWWGEGRPWPTQARMYVFFHALGLSASSLAIADAARLVIVAHLGHLRLNELRAAEGDGFVLALRNQGLKSRTIQLYVTQLQRSLTVAVEDGVLTAAPKLRRPKLTDAKPHRFLTPEQSDQLLAVLAQRVAQGDVDGVSYLAIFTTLSLGMRPGEVLTRRWENIDWRGAGRVRIDAQPMPDGTLWQPKTRTSRTVPLTPPLRAALHAAWEAAGQPKTGWVFQSTTQPLWPLTDYRRALTTSCRLAGVPEIHPHALRHSAATRWAWLGVDRPTAMRLGGWRSAEMLDEVYAHTDENRMDEAMARTAVGKQEPVRDSVRDKSPTVLPHSSDQRRE